MGILMMAITVRNALPHGRKIAESKKNLKGSRRQFTEEDTTESYPNTDEAASSVSYSV